MKMHKCSFNDNVAVKPNGINELDPCLYQEIERYANVTISISRCVKCGHIDISWYRQDDTEQLEVE